MGNNNVEISIIAIDSASNILTNIGDKFGILGQGATVAIGAAAGVMKDLISAGAEAQDTQAMFNAVLDNSPLKDYKNSLLEMADALSKTTRFENDNIVAAETVLARYQNIGQDAMPKVVQTTLDLATIMGTSATDAAQQLGKSLEDIADGSLTLLYRTKLLTAEERDQAVAMAKGGDAAGAQAYILDLLAQKTGGLAEKMGSTYAGQMDIFNNTLTEIKETIGMQLLPIITPLITRFSEIATQYAPQLATVFSSYVIPAVQWLIDTFTKLAEQLAPFIQNELKRLNEWFIENGPLIGMYAQKWGEAFQFALPFILGAIDIIMTALLGFMSLFMNVSLMWQKFWDNFDKAVQGPINAVIGLINNLIHSISSIPGIPSLGIPSLAGVGGQAMVAQTSNGNNQNNIAVNMSYAPTLTTNTAADVQAIMPLIAQGVQTAARNLGLTRY